MVALNMRVVWFQRAMPPGGQNAAKDAIGESQAVEVGAVALLG